MGKVKLRFIVSNISSNWQKKIGSQRDWVWRGWQTRYTYVRCQSNYETREGQNLQHPPILLLHGFGASIGHWRQNINVLSQKHTVYALDLLGFGASEKAIANYNTSFWVEQVYEFWQAFIQVPVILVGNSIGSLISFFGNKYWTFKVKERFKKQIFIFYFTKLSIRFIFLSIKRTTHTLTFF